MGSLQTGLLVAPGRPYKSERQDLGRIAKEPEGLLGPVSTVCRQGNDLFTFASMSFDTLLYNKNSPDFNAFVRVQAPMCRAVPGKENSCLGRQKFKQYRPVCPSSVVVPSSSCIRVYVSRPSAPCGPASDWSRGGHVIQDGGRACAEGGHVREKFPHVREKFPHVREKFPPHTLILVFWGVLGCQNR
ncbi:hypothetical protein J6590_078029 [Homalodisca vitripennis]|nr:hypothetical protein J6590_078029 [Homalodisca vitripennis]